MGLIPVLALAGLVVVGDGIPAPLTATPGDATRGRAIVADRAQGLCLLCHGGPFEQPQLHGNLATNLAGAGARWSAAQLRLRVADSRRLNPQSLMPPMLATGGEAGAEGGARVGTAWQGKPVLNAQQVEDVVAYLVTLK